MADNKSQTAKKKKKNLFEDRLIDESTGEFITI